MSNGEWGKNVVSLELVEVLLVLAKCPKDGLDDVTIKAGSKIRNNFTKSRKKVLSLYYDRCNNLLFVNGTKYPK